MYCTAACARAVSAAADGVCLSHMSTELRMYCAVLLPVLEQSLLLLLLLGLTFHKFLQSYRYVLHGASTCASAVAAVTAAFAAGA